jgi:putative heme-binding domain-containing protein
MTRRLALLSAIGLLAAWPVAARPQDLPAPPPGWRLEVVAEAPRVRHPSCVACSPDGRVFVAEDPMDISAPPDQPAGRILCFHPDGRVTVFAEKLHAVFGLLYLDGKLFVHHSPRLSLFTDDDGVGRDRADLIECTNPKPWALDWNDHVPANLRLAMDGFLYMAVGDKGVFGAVGRDGKPAELRGGGVLRMRPDATALEVHSTGTRNHLDLALNAEDEIFTYDNTDEKSGWWSRLTHMVDGGSYGYPFEWKPRRPWTLPAMAEYGPGAATAGFAYAEDALPEEYRGNLFFGDFTRREVMRLRVERAGASWRVAAREKLLENGPADFRPVGLALAPDGLGIYIGDWRHRDIKEKVVVGRLLKLAWTGRSLAAPKPPWYLPAATGKPFEASTAELVGGLSHPARSVRLVAQRRLAERGKDAVPSLVALLGNAGAPPHARWHAIWALDAIDAARPAILALLRDADPTVRMQAARELGTRRAREAAAPLVALLADADPAVRFHAATALGRIGDPAAVPALLSSLEEKDPFARHASWNALHRIGAWEAAARGLRSANPAVREGTLLALRDAYDEEAVAELSKFIREPGAAPETREAAVETLAALHRKAPPWKGEWWGYFPTGNVPPPERTASWAGTEKVAAALREGLGAPDPVLRRHCVRSLRHIQDSASAPALRELFARETEVAVKRSILFALGAFRDAGSAELVGSILADPERNAALVADAVTTAEEIGAREPLVRFLATRPRDPEILVAAIDGVGSLKAAGAVDLLAAHLKHEEGAVRAAALKALGRIGGEAAVEAVLPLLEDRELEVRKSALAALGSFRSRKAVAALNGAFLREETRFEAAEALARIPDLRALDAYLYGLGTQSPTLRDACRKAVGSLGKEALAAVEKRLEVGALSPQAIGELQRAFAAQKASPLLKARARRADPAAYLDYALKNAGDPDRGRKLFTDSRGVACIRCHRVGEVGADLGPDLSGVGAQLARKDLAESVLVPSKVIKEGYQQLLVLTKDGFIVAGFARGETAEDLVLLDAQGERHLIRKQDIRERKASALSIMPEGLNTGLSLQDFTDLVSFLESLKSPARK